MVDEDVDAAGRRRLPAEPVQLRDARTCAVGETEFLDVTDEDGTVTAQYQLDLLEHQDQARPPTRRRPPRPARKVSKAGRSVLRARQAAAGPLRYRYDAKSGTVRKIGKRAYKALLAKSARAALGTAGGF